jgi:8-oxo-dGTP pyrophosphatase MutT (NUDIX family)
VAVIIREGRLLVIQRSKFVRAPLQWCFPGGGVENGETDEQALVRELQEELSVAVRPVKQLWQSISPWKFDLRWWEAEVDEAAEFTPEPQEVAAIAWMTPAEMRALSDLLPSNREFLDARDRGEF